jgi:hypothetical protein
MKRATSTAIICCSPRSSHVGRTCRSRRTTVQALKANRAAVTTKLKQPGSSRARSERALHGVEQYALLQRVIPVPPAFGCAPGRLLGGC